jgi:hypothetical protein
VVVLAGVLAVGAAEARVAAKVAVVRVAVAMVAVDWVVGPEEVV